MPTSPLTMRLLLARHGEALDAQVDALRPLSAKGRSDVERVASTLAAQGVQVGRVVHSGRRRAEETAVIWARFVAPTVTLTVDPTLDPDEDPAPIVERLGHATEDTLLVGHLPSLPRLANRLLRDAAESSFASFRPGTVQVLVRDPSGLWRRESRLDP